VSFFSLTPESDSIGYLIGLMANQPAREGRKSKRKVETTKFRQGYIEEVAADRTWRIVRLPMDTFNRRGLCLAPRSLFAESFSMTYMQRRLAFPTGLNECQVCSASPLYCWNRVSS
jgi:hypothetical protein